MFEALSGRLNGVFDRLRRRGALAEADVTEALREVRVALLEADVCRWISQGIWLHVVPHDMVRPLDDA